MKKIECFIRYLRNFLIVSMIRIFVSKKIVKKKYYASICGIFKDEGMYLKEWLDYYLILGIDHFYLYNNFSSDNYKKVLKPYIEEGLVSLIDWPVQHGQMSAYHDCVEKFSAESNWIGFIDLDEYVCPIKFDSIPEWLHKYRKFPMALAFWRMFSSSGHLEEDKNKTIPEQFVLCSDLTTSPKMFLNTRWSHKISKFKIAHHCQFGWMKSVVPHDSALFFHVADSKASSEVQINHYFNKSYDFFVKRRLPKGDVYSSENMRNVGNFFAVEKDCNKTDYSIFKYIIKLKIFDLEKHLQNK